MEKARESRRGRIGWLWGVAALAGMVGIAVVASGSAGAFGRHGPGGRDFAERRMERMLDEVGASEEQRRQVESAFEALYEAMEDGRGGRDAREEIASALTGEIIDREALEEIRAEHLRRFDAMSQQVVVALAQAAEALTSEQRAKIAEEMEEHREHRRSRHWH